jgi:hypothetical protein
VKLSGMATAASLLSILLMTLHMTDDVLRNQNGAAQGGVLNIVAVLVLVVWLYGTLMLAERKSGYIIMLVGSLLTSYIAVGHMTGIGDVPIGQIATSSGAFFVWVVVALGVSAISSLVLSVYGLRNLLMASVPQPARGKARRTA